MTTNQQIKYQVLELLFEGPGTHHQIWNRNRKVCSWKSFKLIFETLRWAGLVQRHPYQKQERLFPDEIMGTPIFELVELTMEGRKAVEGWRHRSQATREVHD